MALKEQPPRSSPRHPGESSTKPAEESPSTPAHRSPQPPSSRPAAESVLRHNWQDAVSYNQSLPAPQSAIQSTVPAHPPPLRQDPLDSQVPSLPLPNAPVHTDKPPPPAQDSSTDAEPPHTAPSESSTASDNSSTHHCSTLSSP